MTKKIRLTWEAFYPLIIYEALMVVVVLALEKYTPLEQYSKMIVQGIAQLICMPAMIYFLHHQSGKKGKRHVKFETILCAIIVGVMLSYGLNQLIELSSLKSISGSYQLINDAIYSDQRSWVLLSAGLLAPALEEITFRGILFGNLSTAYGRWIAIIVSALVFGAVHGNIVQFLYAALLGVAFAYLYDRSGDILIPVIAHASANVFALTASWYGYMQMFQTTMMTCMITAIIAVIIGLIALIRWT